MTTPTTPAMTAQEALATPMTVTDKHEAFWATKMGGLLLAYANTAATANYRDAKADGEMTPEVKAAWAASSAAQSALIDAISDAERRATEAGERIASLSRNLMDHERELSAVEARLVDAERRATEAVRISDEIASEKDDLEQHAEDLQSRLSAVEARCGLMREALKNAVSQLENLFAMVEGEVPSLLEDHFSWPLIKQAIDAGKAVLAAAPVMAADTASDIRKQALEEAPRVADDAAGRLRAAIHVGLHEKRPSAVILGLKHEHDLAHEIADAIRILAYPGGKSEEPTANETQASISAWCEATFGPASSNARVASRANEEMAELLKALTKNDADTHAIEEAADIVIILYRLAARMGLSLPAEIDRKMAVNRNREWNVGPDGHGYHVKSREHLPGGKSDQGEKEKP